MQNPNGNRNPRSPFSQGGGGGDQKGKGNGNGQQPAPQPKRPRIPPWVVGLLLVAILGYYVYRYFGPAQNSNQVTIPYSTFLSQVDAKNVKEASVSGSSVEADLNSPILFDTQSETIVATGSQEASGINPISKVKTTIPPVVRQDNAALIQGLTDSGAIVHGVSESGSLLTSILISFLPVLLFLGLIVFMGRQMTRGQQNVFGFGRSRARQHDPERPQVTFADVAGEEEAKRELTEVVDFLRNPAKYHQLGARLPRGVLLVGPPGTGKTLTARAVAGEAGVPFFSISASEFVEMFVGVGASRVRDLFEKAKTNRRRPSSSSTSSTPLAASGSPVSADRTTSASKRSNQLLVEMDGFDTNSEVIVMAATNRPDVLDPALLRPGRFDRQVTVGLPDRKGREAILAIHYAWNAGGERIST